jgi:hypothetical protein
VNSVSIGAETLFTRLIARSDDHAHYYADPPMVTAKLFTHRMCKGEVDFVAVARWINELAAVGLITFYTADGRRYLKIVNCRKSLRNDVLPDVQFPDPPGFEPMGEPAAEASVHGRPDAGRTRAAHVTDAARVRDGSVSSTIPNHTQPDQTKPTPQPPKGEAEGGADAIRHRGKPQTKRAETEPPGFTQFWNAWPTHFRKKARPKCLALWRHRKLEEKTDAILGGLGAWKQSEHWVKEDGRYVPGPHPWLNDETWVCAAAIGAARNAPDAPDPDTFIRAPFTKDMADLLGVPWPAETADGKPVESGVPA